MSAASDIVRRLEDAQRYLRMAGSGVNMDELLRVARAEELKELLDSEERK